MKRFSLVSILMVVLFLYVSLTYSQDLSNLELIAHYPLKGTANDTTGNNEPMDLINTPFQDGGIYCNGNYIWSDPDSCDAVTPAITNLDFESFAVSAMFKVDALPDKRRPVFVCGRNYKWGVSFIDTDGTVGFGFGGALLFEQSSGMPFTPGSWHQVTFTYDSTEGIGRFYLNGVAADSEFFQIDHNDDRAFSITHGSVSRTFKGFLKDLKIYSKKEIITELEQDSLALVALYNSTDGANWTDNTNWLTGPVDTWHGVTVTGGRVTEIDLQANNLTGAIPAEIGNFDSLQVLNFFNNQLSDTIPNEIYNLTKLTGLWLRTNQLTGTISPQISNLINLEKLWLSENQLTDSIPDEIYDMVNLETLMLFSNQLIGTIPSDINNLVNLEGLDLSRNQLTGEIPPEIGDLVNLNSLLLSDNQFADSIPTEIGQLVNLTALYLNNNQLIGTIPNEIGNLTNLVNLRLNYNQLSDTLPVSMWNLINLTSLYLNSNQLIGPISAQILSLTKLKYFCIQWNDFTDLPDLSSIAALNDLYIFGNRFTFEDIEPNITIPNFDYSPQDSVGEAQDITLNEGTSLTFSVVVGGANNQYQWIKDGSVVTGAVSSDYTIDPVNFSDAGMYTCNITNTVATALTLHSRPIQVNVKSLFLEQDSLALVALYDSTDGANWTDNTNWLTGPVSSWFGITIDGGRVTKIELPDNNLDGEIPPALGNLFNLTRLHLSNNQLTGSIPPELGNLTNLTVMIISHNQLNGSIPSQLGDLENLEMLFMTNNQLEGSIPSELGNLSNLTNLYLHNNQLTGSIPSQLSSLTNLNQLRLNDNLLDGSIPSELGDLVKLTTLDLSQNQLIGSIPSQFSHLENLTNLSLDNNQLTGSIPPELENLTKLKSLNLDQNQLEGTIPSELGSLVTLTTLSLYDNQFNGSIPYQLGSLTNLISLRLDQNQLTNSIPEELMNLTNLTNLNLNDNLLTGSMPAGIVNLLNLSSFYIQNNNFTDLPDLSPITGLTTLYMGDNWFTFEDIEPNLWIPNIIYSPQDSVGEEQDTIGYVGSSLTLSVDVGGAQNQYQWIKDGSVIAGATLDDYIMDPVLLSDSGMYHCQITNTLATDLTLYSRPIHVTVDTISELNQDSLALVALYNSTDGANWTVNTNWLTGSVSTWFGITVDEGRVTKIELINNNLTGTMVPEIGDLDSLQILDLPLNQISGTIPTELCSLIQLTKLNLASNQFEGLIPSEIGNLVNLKSINFWKNQLSDSIPSEIGNLTNLEYFNLNDNQLTGPIPPNIGNMTALTRVEMSDNQLSDSIPSGIGNLANLNTLYLGNNQLEGSIPSSIGNLVNLQFLSFSSNELSGSIPIEIGNIASLISLGLADNQLEGDIPAELGNLTNLESLYLEMNHLTGAVPNSFATLTVLEKLFLHQNELTNLPALSVIPTLTELAVYENRLTFEDIEPNIDIADFQYAPQDSVGEEQELSAYEGASLTLSVDVGGTQNQYQWIKDGSVIAGATLDDYIMDPILLSDSGTYHCQITNTLATDLTLYSQPVHVSVLSAAELDSLALVALYDSTDGVNWTDNTNWLSGPMDTWYGITVSGDRVTNIDLPNNNLTGSIPAELGTLTNLTYLYLNNNQLTDSIPPELGSLETLTTLSLYDNQLTGSIPPELGDLTNLTYLSLSSNQLIDSIPPELGKLTNLTQLYLHLNQLTGSVPLWLGNSMDLISLRLDCNQLIGSIPHELGNLTNLIHLRLNTNQLIGSILPELGNLTNLNYLYLHDNQLTGSIPSELGNLANLTTLRFDNNQLTGSIPSEITDLTNLNELNIQSNDFVDLPDLSSITTLADLQIQENGFTFEDIEPNVGIEGFEYTPQDSVGEEQDTTVTEGESLNLSVTVGGTANHYQWFQDGVEIIDSDSSVCVIETVALSDSGVYTCQITNTITPDLTLYSRPITVHVTPGVGVSGRDGATPKKFALLQNYPNPFNPETTIRFDVKEPCRVVLKVYNLMGQEVADLVNEEYSSGRYEVSFNATGFSSGLYFYKIRMGDFQSVKKMVVLE